MVRRSRLGHQTFLHCYLRLRLLLDLSRDASVLNTLQCQLRPGWAQKLT